MEYSSSLIGSEVPKELLPYETIGGKNYLEYGVICNCDDGYLCEERFNYFVDFICKK